MRTGRTFTAALVTAVVAMSGWTAAPAAAQIPVGLGIEQIARGNNGPQVEALQSSLNASEHGISIAVDGIYGPETEAAVRKVQTDHGLVVDGIVGPQTRAVLP